MNENRNELARSFIPVTHNSDFPIQNLPYGVFQPDAASAPRIGVAIGDQVLDLSVIEGKGLFNDALGSASGVFSHYCLNPFMGLGRETWYKVRAVLKNILDAEEPVLRDDYKLRKMSFFPLNQVRMLIPVEIGDYTDFYSSREHAQNIGTMFRGATNALLPNWKHLPVAYHGRASSIILSGTEVRRPLGQRLNSETNSPEFGPTDFLDFELEMGFVIGTGNEPGQPIAINDTLDHIFGMVIVNDWSARDMQSWEYQPLGPFLSKNFATTISPWVVPMEALMPFTCEPTKQDPQPLPYLQADKPLNFDIHLTVSVQSDLMKKPDILAHSNTRYLYWNIMQQLAHHTINGCHVRTGDLMASGTISGPERNSWGSMLELAWNRTSPIRLSSGEDRTTLHDGDMVILNAWCQSNEYRIGFGGASGKILPAHPGK